MLINNSSETKYVLLFKTLKLWRQIRTELCLHVLIGVQHSNVPLQVCVVQNTEQQEDKQTALNWFT